MYKVLFDLPKEANSYVKWLNEHGYRHEGPFKEKLPKGTKKKYDIDGKVLKYRYVVIRKRGVGAQGGEPELTFSEIAKLKGIGYGQWDIAKMSNAEARKKLGKVRREEPSTVSGAEQGEELPTVVRPPSSRKTKETKSNIKALKSSLVKPTWQKTEEEYVNERYNTWYEVTGKNSGASADEVKRKTGKWKKDYSREVVRALKEGKVSSSDLDRIAKNHPELIKKGKESTVANGGGLLKPKVARKLAAQAAVIKEQGEKEEEKKSGEVFDNLELAGIRQAYYKSLGINVEIGKGERPGRESGTKERAFTISLTPEEKALVKQKEGEKETVSKMVTQAEKAGVGHGHTIISEVTPETEVTPEMVATVPKKKTKETPVKVTYKFDTGGQKRQAEALERQAKEKASKETLATTPSVTTIPSPSEALSPEVDKELESERRRRIAMRVLRFESARKKKQEELYGKGYVPAEARRMRTPKQREARTAEVEARMATEKREAAAEERRKKTGTLTLEEAAEQAARTRGESVEELIKEKAKEKLEAPPEHRTAEELAALLKERVGETKKWKPKFGVEEREAVERGSRRVVHEEEKAERRTKREESDEIKRAKNQERRAREWVKNWKEKRGEEATVPEGVSWVETKKNIRAYEAKEAVGRKMARLEAKEKKRVTGEAKEKREKKFATFAEAESEAERMAKSHIPSPEAPVEPDEDKKVVKGIVKGIKRHFKEPREVRVLRTRSGEFKVVSGTRRELTAPTSIKAALAMEEKEIKRKKKRLEAPVKFAKKHLKKPVRVTARHVAKAVLRRKSSMDITRGHKIRIGNVGMEYRTAKIADTPGLIPRSIAGVYST